MSDSINKDYEINLLSTAFNMRGNLTKLEPQMLQSYQDLYTQVRQICAGRPKFILHDGPPYANGTLHLGHAANRILKDLVIRSKTLAGYDAPYWPGWDCHGLPIELNIEKKFGKTLTAAAFRAQCRSYADEQIALQKQDIMRLGVLADWAHPYKTMNYNTEAATVRVLAEIYRLNYLQQGFKPVYWCLDCQSALAEAELEYHDKQSLAVDVMFAAANSELVATKFRYNYKLQNNISTHSNNQLKPIFAVIWTTTPWTLAANQALCVGAQISYSLVELADKYLIIASNLLAACSQRYQLTDFIVRSTCLGSDLALLEFIHPFIATKIVPIICGEHATDTAGTGLVHTAPAHGYDDYLMGSRYSLDIDSPVEASGHYHSDTPYLANLHIFAANQQIVTLLEQQQRLLAVAEITHSYPCCWRHKTKLIIRATKQWFILLDNNQQLRQQAIDAIDSISFFPANAKNRLLSMVNNRPDWCLSRQRTWGTPIPFFIHNITGEPHPDSYNLLHQVANIIAQEGIEGWFTLPISKLLSHDDVANYSKTSVVVDVWFDAGATHDSVLRCEHNVVADLYLEGSDQHRGWFQSSLLIGCMLNGSAPYKQILTHGFLVDSNGHKMSKSLGNIVSIRDMANKYGADILRLWVASTDYTQDIPYSAEVMQGVQASYRIIRNTIRFLLMNVSDFSQTDNIAQHNLLEIDQYALIYFIDIATQVQQLYAEYKFHLAVKMLLKYCSEWLSSFYLDILKDRLYTVKATCATRRSCQTVLYIIARELLLLLAPILAFTADEAFAILTNSTASCLFYTHNYNSVVANAATLLQKWEIILAIRQQVLVKLEEARAAGLIGSSLQAELTINATLKTFNALSSLEDDLRFVYMVSRLTVNFSTLPHDTVQVVVSALHKCKRCWHYVITDAAADICDRCITNLNAGEVRRFA